jgi:hypothetical protein
VKTTLLLAASALALTTHTPVAAQSMPGMAMPGMTHGAARPAPRKPAAMKPPGATPVAKKKAKKKAATRAVVVRHPMRPAPRPVPAAAKTMPAMSMPAAPAASADHAMSPGMDPAMPGMDQSPAAASTPDHAGMSHMDHAPSAPNVGEAMPGMGHGMTTGAMMTGALGPYGATREASGTAWQPDDSADAGVMASRGDWMLMLHGTLNLVADTQGGPRGADKLFASGMLMGMAQRPIPNGVLQFKAMLSPDPLMGKAGYPLLLASGETADGVTRLIDRQHPHDLFMELSGSVSQTIGRNSSVFLYAGLPGEPAFGPPAFMHREAIMDSPEAPISHHWLDSTHISFGVVTGGVVLGKAKVEISRFNGREPDQHRYNIETGPLDSTAVRLSWNPTASLALQGSYGYFKDPEQLEPDVNQKRLSASALYAREIAPGTKLSATLAWGRKTIDGHSDDAFALEAGLKRGPWTVFSRAELTENSELVVGVDHGPSYTVGKASIGVIRDVRIAPHLAFGVGGLFSINAVPDALAAAYAGHHPTGAMGFVRLKLM